MENRYLISGKQLGILKKLILQTSVILEVKEPIIDRKQAIKTLKRLDACLTKCMEKQWVGLRNTTIDKDVQALLIAYKKLEG